MRIRNRRGLAAIAASTAVLLVVTAATAVAHPDGSSGGVTDDPDNPHADVDVHLHDFDKDGPLLGQDEFDIISGGPYSKVEKNLNVAGRGVRNEANVTTDVWAHDGYAYTGTFSTLCSDGPGGDESGVWIWDVRNKNRPSKVGVIETTEHSKTNDVKVFEATSGRDVLVMSNESCESDAEGNALGEGGVDLYDVTDPHSPALLAELRVDDANPYFAEVLELTDLGVHNIYVWSRDGTDYMGLSVNGAFGNFKIFDITDPTSPELLSTWGPEEVSEDWGWLPGAVGLDSFADGDVATWEFVESFGLLVNGVYGGYLFDGYGASANRFMHDLFVNKDGTKAYVNFWDAGMVLLDISDPANPAYVSTALDPTSTDGEVNSHSVWTEDDVVVVEGEEDFAPYDQQLKVGGDSYPTVVGAINTSGDVNGPTVYVGLACDGSEVPAASGSGQIALVQRGVCAFTLKGQNVVAKGYEGMVVFNDEARGDALVRMGGDDVPIPGVFVGHSSGLAIAGVATAGDLVIGDPGATVEGLIEVWNGWSGLRIWDYSDPENPVLASTFDTACSALEPGTDGAEDCIEGGTYSSHNLVIEDGIAYISWYADGMLMLDVSDPYNPVEVGRYHERGDAFEAQNAGPQDIWGVHKIEDEPWVYASDRNGGLYVLKAYGQGSAKKGKAERGG